MEKRWRIDGGGGQREVGPRLRGWGQTLTKRTIPAYIEFCQEVHAFREHCDSSQGGSEFSKKGCEWLSCDSGTLTRWEAVGRRSTELLGATQKLPVSEHAISLLASLDDIAFPKAQASISAAKYANMTLSDAGKKSHDPASTNLSGLISQEKAAEVFKVSPMNVKKAKSFIETAHPELVDMVEKPDSKVSLDAACLVVNGYVSDNKNPPCRRAVLCW